MIGSSILTSLDIQLQTGIASSNYECKPRVLVPGIKLERPYVLLPSYHWPKLEA